MYTVGYWTTYSVLPLTLFSLSWQVFLASRRADVRALNVPKHALSIFLMMIPLAIAIVDLDNPVKTVNESGKLTAEQKRKVIKAVMMKEGPRPKQIFVVVLIWVISLFLSCERLLSTMPDNREPPVRQYKIKPSDNSSKEITIMRDMDLTYCSVWNNNVSSSDLIFWLLIVALPLFFGPFLTTMLELLYSMKKKCSKAPYPVTASLFRYWLILILSSVIATATYSTHLLLAEAYMENYFQMNFFQLLVGKYFFGRLELMIIPLLVILVDKQLREGVCIVFYSKTRGALSKTTSISTNL